MYDGSKKNESGITTESEIAVDANENEPASFSLRSARSPGDSKHANDDNSQCDNGTGH